jgi:hypothetical protein
MSEELASFDLPDDRTGKLTDLLSLVVGDRGPEVLYFGMSLADEGHERYFRDAGNPGNSTAVTRGTSYFFAQSAAFSKEKA